MNLSKNEILEMTKRIISEERAKKQNITENRLLIKESDILKLVKESVDEVLSKKIEKYVKETSRSVETIILDYSKMNASYTKKTTNGDTFTEKINFKTKNSIDSYPSILKTAGYKKID